MAKKKYIMRALSVGLSLALCAGLVAPALAVTYYMEDGNVFVRDNNDGKGVFSYQSKDGGWYNYEDIDRTYTSEDGEIIITQRDSGTETANVISVVAARNTDATVTLRDVNINAGTAMLISGDGSGYENINVTVELDGVNTLKGGLELAGASVIIRGKDKNSSLMAQGGYDHPGIGSASYTDGGNITIIGTKVIAKAGRNSGSAGIGNSANTCVNNITISDSEVEATGDGSSPGIGGGCDLSPGDKRGVITIEKGSIVKAIGGDWGSGIGLGENGKGHDIIINGSTVEARGGVYGAGIGGELTTSGDITIINSTVDAKGGMAGVGIGSNNAHWTGAITIDGDSTVTVAGGGTGHGISGGDITIGNKVTLLARAHASEYTIMEGWAVSPFATYYTEKGQTGNILVGMFAINRGIGTDYMPDYDSDAAYETQRRLIDEHIFIVLHKDGSPVLDKNGNPMEFDMSGDLSDGNTGLYYSFAIILPESETDYIIAPKSTWGQTYYPEYLVYGDNMVVYRINTREDGSGIPMQVDGLRFKSVETKYEFRSEDGSELPDVVKNQLWNYEVGYIGVGNVIDVESQGGKWILTRSEKTDEGGIGADGRLHDVTYTGTWRWEDYPHTHSYTPTITTKPTCATEGVKTFTCECGDSYTEPVEKSTIHSPWGEWKETKPATCEEKGEETRTCGTCGEVERRDIDKLTTHSAWGDWTETKPATCKEKGEETRTCGTCGEVERRDIDKLTTHSPWSEWEETKPATCKEKGEETRTCGTCGEVERRDIDKLTTHSAWGDWTETKPATCKEKGEETRTCGTCGEVERRDIDPNGHDDGEWKVTKEPTYDEAGEKTLFCTVCGDELGKEEIDKLVRPTTPVTGGGNSFDFGETQIDDVAVPLAGLFTRADAIGYLWEKSVSPEWTLSDFPDVPEDHQWAVAIGWAQDMGIALPDLDGNFRPDDLVLRSVEDIKLSPEGELEQFLNRYAVYAGIELEPGKLFFALDGEWDEIIMGEDAQIIFNAFFAKLEAALAELAA